MAKGKHWIERVAARSFRTDTGCVCCDHDGSASGHIQVWHNGKRQLLHRLAYAYFKGSLPDTVLVRRTCDTPSCWNPEHLVLGTVLNNVQDRVDRERSAVGTDFNRSALTDYDTSALA